MRLLTSILTLTIAGAAVSRATAEAASDRQTGWDREAAAQYLDDRIDLWFQRASELRTGDGKTTCISCHTVVPYLLARPALRQAMHAVNPTLQEVRLLEEMGRRVDTYPNHDSKKPKGSVPEIPIYFQ